MVGVGRSECDRSSMRAQLPYMHGSLAVAWRVPADFTTRDSGLGIVCDPACLAYAMML
jgi:hypothetical protein